MVRNDRIIIVSGLPRSGTSMMMQVLEAGGIPVLTDRLRVADEDNRRGYYELESVKKLPSNSSFLDDADGKSVKIISDLLRYLPDSHSYDIIFMERDIDEVLLSQRQMLVRRNKPTDVVDDNKMARLFLDGLDKIKTYIRNKGNMRVLYANYNSMLSDPTETLKSICEFIGIELDLEAMLQVVDPNQYRQRRPS